jgi:3-dehydroquinate synthase
MKTISVQADREYDVLIDCDWKSELISLAKGRTRVAVIHSEQMSNQVRIESDIDAEIFYFPLPDGELAKSFTTISQLWNWLGAAGFTRSDLVVGVGGGAVTDVAGFAAASWLRGVDWIAVPTSVAGMVDAAVGGKTGINSDYGKNLIGAFHSPVAVLVDLNWLTTLSDRDFSAGMAEVIKCGFIAENEILTLLSNQSLSELRRDQARVTALIEAAVTVKAAVVSRDFKEGFAREVLNYGHTLGHAVEIHSKYSLRHGEAVSIGLVFAAELANIKGLLSKELVDKHRELLSSLDLPISYPRAAWSDLMPLLALDKKSRGKSLRFVAISAIGATLRIEDVLESELVTAYERIGL